MTNYNDGNWHGWIKGGCPVHPCTIVEILHAENGILFERKAGITAWNDANLIAFRVIKEHKEPREFYLEHNLGYWAESIPCRPGAILFREVLE